MEERESGWREVRAERERESRSSGCVNVCDLEGEKMKKVHSKIFAQISPSSASSTSHYSRTK